MPRDDDDDDDDDEEAAPSWQVKKLALTRQELQAQRDRQAETQAVYSSFLRMHDPELKKIIGEVQRAVLVEKPADVFDFFQRHFAALSVRSGALPPALWRGPPPLVITGRNKTDLFSALADRFPGLLERPLVSRTRPPTVDERPGVSCDFTTRAEFRADATAGKYFEHGGDADGASDDDLAGTSLLALAVVKRLGRVPVVHVPRDRALVALDSDAVKPKPISIWLMSKSEHARYLDHQCRQGEAEEDHRPAALLADEEKPPTKTSRPPPPPPPPRESDATTNNEKNKPDSSEATALRSSRSSTSTTATSPTRRSDRQTADAEGPVSLPEATDALAASAKNNYDDDPPAETTWDNDAETPCDEALLAPRFTVVIPPADTATCVEAVVDAIRAYYPKTLVQGH